MDHANYEGREKVCAIIVAGGTGSRISLSMPKQYYRILDKPILAYTIKSFADCTAVDEIVLVVGENYISYCKNEIVDKYSFYKVKKIIPGGSDRQASVYNGLRAIERADVVLIHDGVRPFVSDNNIRDVIVEAGRSGCCALGVRAKDTIKVCAPDLTVRNTPDRETLWLAQTPQGFEFELLQRAYEGAAIDGFSATDDASIVEYAGHTVKIVPGSYENIKITTNEDLMICEWMMKNYL